MAPAVLSEIFLAVIGFVSTNVENVAILVGVFCSEPGNAGGVRLGFVLGSAALSLSWLTARVCDHPALSAPLRRYGPRLAPLFMIAIGIYILVNTGTDLVPDP